MSGIEGLLKPLALRDVVWWSWVDQVIFVVFSSLSDSVILFRDSMLPHLLLALFCGILVLYPRALCQSLCTVAGVRE